MIAENHMTASAQSAVDNILGPQTTLADESSWADRIKGYHPETKPWHYVNLPISKDINLNNLPSYCSGDDNIVRQIEIQIEKLKKPEASRKEKRDALRYLTHFIGDIHMPLHCAVDGDDEGGNRKRVWFSGHWTNLHTLWDRLLRDKDTYDSEKIARRLDAAFSKNQQRAWAGGTPAGWAFESYRIAKENIYPDYWKQSDLQGKRRIKLNRAYQETMQPLVDQQLEKAGIRLAWILNGIFSKP
jgi:hypothetical protein